MTTTELILNMLAETATKDIANATHPEGLEENKKVAKRMEVLQEMLEKRLNKKQENPLSHLKMQLIQES